MELSGGCLCGAVRFQISAEPIAAYYCHCGICKKNAGGPFVSAATVRADAMTFTKGEPKAYESSPGFVRLFCGVCGTAMSFRKKSDPKLASFRLGCLDNPNAVKPQFHMYSSDQVNWLQEAESLPRYSEGAPELAKLWAEVEGWKPPA